MWATPLRCPHIHRPARVLQHSKCTLGDVSIRQGVTRRARRRPQLPSLVSVPCPHTVRSTHAGGLFHSFWFASMSVFIRGGHDNGTVLLVRGLPGSSIRLPPLRPWPNLLCRRLCTRSASALSARSRPALSGNRPRAHETCGAQQALSRPNENSDASGFHRSLGMMWCQQTRCRSPRL